VCWWRGDPEGDYEYANEIVACAAYWFGRGALSLAGLMTRSAGNMNLSVSEVSEVSEVSIP